MVIQHHGSVRGSTIPRTLTSLIDRDRDIEAIRDLLGDHRLVTLTGTGGVGKTRVAAETASRVAADGVVVHWIDVAPATSPEILRTAVATRIGAKERPERSWGASVQDAIGDEPVLLVLDNCEHLLDAVAGLVAELTAAAPGLSALLTSREPLGTTGEVVYRVPSLSITMPVPAPQYATSAPPEAASTELFLQRAREVRPDLPTDDGEMATIRAICARVDGIPLAIELAAARARHMSLEAILEALQDRFRLLTGGSRNAVARHRTMRMSLDWSYRLLDKREQCTLRAVSVFRGRFTLQSASDLVSEVCGLAHGEAEESIVQLVDKSMVTFDGERYSLLDTVRAYATEITDPDQLVAIRDAHAMWFARWLAQLRRGHSRAEADAQIVESEPDVIAALDWSRGAPERAASMLTNLAYFWYRHSRLADIVNHGLGTLRDLQPVDELLWAKVACDLSLPCLAARCREFLSNDLPRAIGIVERAGCDREAAYGHLVLAFDGQSWEEGAAAMGCAERTGSRTLVTRCAAQLCIIGIATADPPTARAAVETVQEQLAENTSTDVEMQGMGVGYWDYIQGRLDSAGARFANLLSIEHVDPTVQLTSAIAAFIIGVLRGDAALADLGLEASRGAAVRHQGEQFVDVLTWLAEPTTAPPPPDTSTMPFVGLWNNVGALAFVDAARFDDARTLLSLRPTDAAPGSYLATARAAVLASMSQLSGDDDVEHQWREILADATTWGYALIAIDAFEALAARSTGVPKVARRLLDAAEGLRESTGRTHRFAFQQAWVHEVIDVCRGLPVADPPRDVDWTAVAAWVERGRHDRHRPSLGWSSLTRTERSVVGLLAEGLTNREIAERLLMSRATVKTHLAHVFTKLDVHTRTELVSQWHRQGQGQGQRPKP